MDSPLLPLENHALRSDLSRSPKVSSHIRHFSGLHKTELLTSLLFKLSVILEILTLLCELRLLLGQSLLLLQKQRLLLADLIEIGLCGKSRTRNGGFLLLVTRLPP